jgi:hypothetical protein
VSEERPNSGQGRQFKGPDPRDLLVLGSAMGGALAFCTIGGILLDDVLHTTPWLTLAGVVVGSVAALGIIFKAAIRP